jgi:hypothetical protein
MSIIPAVSKVAEAIAVWLNPERKEKAVLRRAIEAAEQLLMILRKQGRYKDFNKNALRDHEIHFQKQFDAWKDGSS